MIRLGHAHIFERCGGSSSDAMLWPSKNAPILVYLIILSHGRSRLWRATSTLVIQGMIRSWFCSRPRQRLSRTTRRTDGQTMDTPLNSGDFLDYLFDNFINRCFDTVSIHWQSEVWGEQKRSATFALEWFFSENKNSANVDERTMCMCSFGLQARFLHTYKNITCVRDICIGPESWFFA